MSENLGNIQNLSPENIKATVYTSYSTSSNTDFILSNI